MTKGIIVSQEITLKEAAATMAASGFFSDARAASQAAVKIMVGAELGIAPGASMRGIHVFDGKVELGAAFMQMLINMSPRHELEELTHPDEANGWTAKLIIATMGKRSEKWEEGPEFTFGWEDAERAKLTNKDNWKKYPGDMAYARALARAFRHRCPELAGGAVYSDGEVSTDTKPEPPLEVKAEVVDVNRVEPAPVAEEAEDKPVETVATKGHPYGRFCKALEEVKAEVVELTGSEEQYRAVLGSRGYANKGEVPKGDTALMAGIYGDLQERLNEIRVSKADEVKALFDGEEVFTEERGESIPSEALVRNDEEDGIEIEGHEVKESPAADDGENLPLS